MTNEVYGRLSTYRLLVTSEFDTCDEAGELVEVEVNSFTTKQAREFFISCSLTSLQ